MHLAQTQRPGFNDEKLSGDREGQHSIRLNQAYRAFCTVSEEGEITVTVTEVNKHDYQDAHRAGDHRCGACLYGRHTK